MRRRVIEDTDNQEREPHKADPRIDENFLGNEDSDFEAAVEQQLQRVENHQDAIMPGELRDDGDVGQGSDDILLAMQQYRADLERPREHSSVWVWRGITEAISKKPAMGRGARDVSDDVHDTDDDKKVDDKRARNVSDDAYDTDEDKKVEGKGSAKPPSRAKRSGRNGKITESRKRRKQRIPSPSPSPSRSLSKIPSLVPSPYNRGGDAAATLSGSDHKKGLLPLKHPFFE